MTPQLELLCRVFCARDHAHISHLSTKSYSEHKALNSFYDDVLDPLDSFIEKYQGAFGLLNLNEKELDDKYEEEEEKNKSGDILNHLQNDVKWIEKSRTKLASDVRALENVVDEITGVYLSTIYKLRFLS